jgi:hypothetical protein
MFKTTTLILALIAVAACKTTQADDANQTSLSALTPGTGMLVLGFDGPKDKGEVNRGVEDGALRCIGNPNLVCHIAVKAGDLSYKELSQQCAAHPRCNMTFFRSDDEVLALLSSFKGRVKVGLLIGHHTGQGIWDYPTLTAVALDEAAAYPLVLRICNSEAFASDQPGLVPVGGGLLSETDLTYVAAVQSLLMQ